MAWIALLVLLIVVVGALAGGNSFGQTVRRGIGCLAILLLLLIAMVVLFPGDQM
jgi:hypothetical protein